MVCKKCGAINEEQLEYCNFCGATLENCAQEKRNKTYLPKELSGKTPEMYRPLGAWAYFGYQLLFAIPVVGFILLIVFSCDSSNLNRRNFARSYWCSLLVFSIVVILIVLLIISTGVSIEALTQLM